MGSLLTRLDSDLVLLVMAMKADLVNLLLSFISACIVGNVEAPAKANIIEPNAEIRK